MSEIPDSALSELGQEMVRHARLLHRVRSTMTLWAPPGLDGAAFAVLVHLVKGGAQRQQCVAASAMLDPSTTSRHVAQLVNQGLAERRPDPADGRAVLLAATQRGESVFADVMQHRHALFAEVLSGWRPEDLTTLTRLLGRLNDDFEGCHLEDVAHRLVAAPVPPAPPAAEPATDPVPASALPTSRTSKE